MQSLIFDTTLMVVSLFKSAFRYSTNKGVCVCTMMLLIDLEILFVEPSMPRTPPPEYLTVLSISSLFLFMHRLINVLRCKRQLGYTTSY